MKINLTWAELVLIVEQVKFGPAPRHITLDDSQHDQALAHLTEVMDGLEMHLRG